MRSGLELDRLTGCVDANAESSSSVASMLHVLLPPGEPLAECPRASPAPPAAAAADAALVCTATEGPNEASALMRV
jgi:hypothetical protein